MSDNNNPHLRTLDEANAEIVSLLMVSLYLLDMPGSEPDTHPKFKDVFIDRKFVDRLIELRDEHYPRGNRERFLAMISTHNSESLPFIAYYTRDNWSSIHAHHCPDYNTAKQFVDHLKKSSGDDSVSFSIVNVIETG